MSADDITNTVTSDKLQPVTADGLPIKYNENNATMAGILFEIFAFWKRNGLFQEYIAHHAAPLNNGRLAVDSVNSIPFILGTYKDARTAGTICPPTPTRMSEYSSKKTAYLPSNVLAGRARGRAPNTRDAIGQVWLTHESRSSGS